MEDLNTIVSIVQLPVSVALTIAVITLWREIGRLQSECKADRDSAVDKLERLYNRLIDDPPKLP